MNNQKISNKLELKDLVLIGVYAVIYLVMMFAVGMIGSYQYSFSSTLP